LDRHHFFSIEYRCNKKRWVEIKISSSIIWWRSFKDKN